MNQTAVFLEAEEGGYIGFVEELPGANTQGEPLEECRQNLREATPLVLGANRELAHQHIQGKQVIKEAIAV
jgi:predicted RNase H-like HicB family nuclease